jgi:type III restriction enzyme
MNSLILKQYQETTLTVLSTFLQKARYLPMANAFKETVEHFEIKTNSYSTKELGEIPYICLRLPTGGGKTLLATHAIHKAAHHYLHQVYPIVLWLAPTTTICDQTIEALQKPNHPYRVELNKLFHNNIVISSIENANNIQAYDIGKKVIIIVSTFANPRVNKTSERAIYSHNENLEQHFQDLTPIQKIHLEKSARKTWKKVIF